MMSLIEKNNKKSENPLFPGGKNRIIPEPGPREMF